jgi:Family of unknown function (DUF6941)
MLTSESDAAAGTSLEQTPALQALLLADHVYRDEVTGKYVIAGTFHQINLEEFPGTLGKTVGIFVSLAGAPKTLRDVSFEFVEAATGEVLMTSPALEVVTEDPELPVDFAVEVPPLPLPRPGLYRMRITANGAVLGEATVSARSVS